MASLQAPASVLFLLLLACTSMSSLVEDRCSHYADGDFHDGSYDYCLKTLGSDQASATADELGLALIAIRLARAAAKATGARIAGLQGAETVPARRECLAKCAAEYAAAPRRLGHAAKNAASGGDAGLKEAETLLLMVSAAPQRCESIFAAAGQRSPMVIADRKLEDVVSLAVGILPWPTTTKTRV